MLREDFSEEAHSSSNWKEDEEEFVTTGRGWFGESLFIVNQEYLAVYVGLPEARRKENGRIENGCDALPQENMPLNLVKEGLKNLSALKCYRFTEVYFSDAPRSDFYS